MTAKAQTTETFHLPPASQNASVNERVSVIEAVLAHLATKAELEKVRTEIEKLRGEVHVLKLMLKMQFACTLALLGMVGTLFVHTIG